MKIAVAALLGAMVLVGAAMSPARAGALDDIKARGSLKCGVVPNNPGFSQPDAQGKMQGFDVDFCYGLAAAIFGSADKGDAIATQTPAAFTTLSSGGIDILTYRFTDTYGRDNGAGLEFVETLFFDGQGFMVPKALNITSAKQLSGGVQVCVTEGTTTELNVANFFKSINQPYKIVTFDTVDAARVAYDDGRCDAWSNDRSSLASRRLVLKSPNDNVILPETISNEPIGPWVRQGDQAWAHTARWVFYGLIAAEEMGITQANVQDMAKNSKDPNVLTLLGTSQDIGQKIGLPRDWAVNAIKAVGNYGEIWNRHIGPGTPLNLARGRNGLSSDGGLLYAPPFQ